MVKCKLCKKESELQESHIIPKFVFKWLKTTSATGLLRKSINPNLPIQDGIKEKLLCKACEQKFCLFESHFAKNIFYPYQRDKKINFNIDKNIHLFAISLSWRIGYYSLNSLKGFENFQPNMFPYFKKAMSHWEYVLNEEVIDDTYEHHISFFDLKDIPKDNGNKFGMYMFRAVDATFGANLDTIFCYTKLPGIFLVSLIHPSYNYNCINTELSIGNKITGFQSYIHSGFDEFLNHRVSEAFKNRLSPVQQQKLTKRIEQNKNRARTSESFRVRFRGG